MLDDRKHTEEVKVRLTERELVDLMRLAASEDRKPAEMIRHLIRQSMYGSVCRIGCPEEGPQRADGARE